VPCVASQAEYRRQRPEVYRRRRIVLFVAVAVLLLLLWWAGRALVGWLSGDEDPAATPAPTAQAEPTPTPSVPTSDAPTTEPTASAAPGSCAEGLEVLAGTDASSYEAGQEPVLSAVVTLAGDQAACTIDGEQVEMVLTSGDDRVWSTADCGTDLGNPPELAPGGRAEVSLAWPRQRSAPGCPSDLGEPGPGTYQLTVTVAGTTSEPVSFTIA
jgi:hypothetical protein